MELAAVKVKRYTDTLDMVELVETRLIDATKFRMRTDLGDIDALMASISENGLIYPLVVRPANDTFELVAGHRRFAACRKLRWPNIPCTVNDLTTKEAFELSLVENVQRETLNPVDEAKAFKQYVKDHGWGSVSELAQRIKKSEEYVSHRIMLLNLPETVLEDVRVRRLAASSAYELHLLSDPEQQKELAGQVINRRLSVRETREAARLTKEGLFSFEASQLWSTNSRLPNEKLNGRTYDQTILALKMCLIRLDALLRGVKQAEVSEDIRSVRITVHSLIDKCLNAAKGARVTVN
jgi:ParB family chromosome partitioning protein